ncbi:MAG: molybdopterin molybdotransferase MoeA [Clostridiales bacterium]|nr:molybdopterin molybdotransferase MoeA [Clostridiales bacterium]
MLDVVTKDEAVETVRRFSGTAPGTEKVGIADALHRVLSRDILSSEDVPPFDRSTVDGFAVRAADTFGAGDAIPSQLEVAGEILMGEKAGFTLKSGQCAKISTGGMLPGGADAAVPVEHADCRDGLCLVYKAASPNENVTKKGDDIAAGEIALKKGTVLTPAGVGVLAALGVYEVPVFRKPVIAVISTGDEIADGAPEDGQIRDINTYLLSAAIRERGCEVYAYGAVRDDKDGIEKALISCLERSDAVIISGGSSAGARDMTVDIIGGLGTAYFHGIAMKPGKPTIFGTVGNKPVFGLPGHPLAAYFVFRLIVTEYIGKILCLPADRPVKTGVLKENIPSNHGREEYICVKLSGNNEIEPVHTKSGIISVLGEADGFIKIARDTEGLPEGAAAEIYKL